MLSIVIGIKNPAMAPGEEPAAPVGEALAIGPRHVAAQAFQEALHRTEFDKVALFEFPVMIRDTFPSPEEAARILREKEEAERAEAERIAAEQEQAIATKRAERMAQVDDLFLGAIPEDVAMGLSDEVWGGMVESAKSKWAEAEKAAQAKTSKGKANVAQAQE